MKKVLWIAVLGLLFNFYISVQALDSPKNYLKGKFYSSVKNFFLVATEKMKDPRFKNTVIIMLENDEKGARGLVINKPLASIPLGSLIYKSRNATIKQKELYNVKIPVYWGGPVNENKIVILHSQEYKNKTTKNFKNISISSDYNILFEIADNKGPKKNLVIVGISSWGEGQLEGEMEREHWTLSEVNTDLIFEMDNTEKWLNAINNSFIRL
jgi:putative transcriptional regulator